MSRDKPNAAFDCYLATEGPAAPDAGLLIATSLPKSPTGYRIPGYRVELQRASQRQSHTHVGDGQAWYQKQHVLEFSRRHGTSVVYTNESHESVHMCYIEEIMDTFCVLIS